jgi:L-histidine N-alpha-methyltransferase
MSNPIVLSTATADTSSEASDACAEILLGLTARQKHISPKYFYDERGSHLFDQICQLPEYYVTRTELQLMDSHFDEVADLVGPRASIIEFGAGSNIKIRKLLDHLAEPAAYVPVDISGDYLLKQATALTRDYPNVHVQPVFADFTQPFDLPQHPVMPERNLVFFPGSTIGNFAPGEALELLKVMRLEARPGGALLIGVDLRKNPDLIHAAYNDSEGVTAEFNLNVLRRLNTEFDGNFDLANFSHQAIYDKSHGRIEMRLISQKAQKVFVAGQELSFAANEFIITEHSYKYSLDGFNTLARSAGWEPEQSWVDENSLFSMHYLTVC